MHNDAKTIITTLNNIIFILHMDQQKIYDLQATNQNQENLLYHVYVGKVSKIDYDLQAAFVEYSKGKFGFLPLKEAMNYHPELKGGSEIIVQIKKNGIKTKLPLLSTKVQIIGDFCILTWEEPIKNQFSFAQTLNKPLKEKLLDLLNENKLSPEFSLLFRSSCISLDKHHLLLAEIQALENQLKELINIGKTRTCFSCIYTESLLLRQLKIMHKEKLSCQEIITDKEDIYEELKQHELNPTLYTDKIYSLSLLYGIKTKIELLLKPRVWLASGAYLMIEHTEAMTVIDINSGKMKKTKNNTKINLSINKEAALEIAIQLKLRNISGIIMIDFINMSTMGEQEELLLFMKNIVSRDSIQTVVVDITPLGIMEITRKKEQASLQQITKNII